MPFGLQMRYERNLAMTSPGFGPSWFDLKANVFEFEFMDVEFVRFAEEEVSVIFGGPGRSKRQCIVAPSSSLRKSLKGIPGFILGLKVKRNYK